MPVYPQLTLVPWKQLPSIQTSACPFLWIIFFHCKLTMIFLILNEICYTKASNTQHLADTIPTAQDIAFQKCSRISLHGYISPPPSIKRKTIFSLPTVITSPSNSILRPVIFTPFTKVPFVVSRSSI